MRVGTRVLLLIYLCPAVTNVSAGEGATRIWIDTDAACGAGLLKDVDDCLAIALLLSNPKWDVVGISTVFGNAALKKTDRTVRRLVDEWCDHCVPVYRGAGAPGAERTLGAQALAQALKREPLTVFVFGPATNVSTALRTPGTLKHEHHFVAVAGTRERRTRLRVTRYSPFPLRDLNFVSDPDAFEHLLSSKLNLSLVPFELAQQVTFRARHIKQLGRQFPELAAQSRRWLWVWRLLFGMNGFHPFDAVAVGLLFRDQSGLVCSEGRARVVDQQTRSGRTGVILHVLMESSAPNVNYCYEVAGNYADFMLAQLTDATLQVSQSQ